MLDLDQAGVEGQIREFVLTDRGAWHWERLALPAGVRFGSFRFTAPTREPMEARLRLTADGVEGKVSAGPFTDVGDAVLAGPGGRHTALRLKEDGTFAATAADALPPGQFLASTLLTDRQQRRQVLYRELLKATAVGRVEEPRRVLAWASPIEMPFRVGREPAAVRTVGDALLVLPVRLERPAPGATVTIPGALLSYHRVAQGDLAVRPLLDSPRDTDMQLRFQVPPELLPFKVERASLVARIDAPSHRLTVFGRTDAGATKDSRAAGNKAAEVVRDLDGHVGPLRVDLADERFLKLDADGGLHLNVALRGGGDVGAKGKASAREEKWTIHFLDLEVVGRALPGP
jgi:hypothetical protein